jgi:choline kinase
MKKSDVIILAASPSKYNLYAPLVKIKGKSLIHTLVKKISNNKNINNIIVVGGHNFAKLEQDLSSFNVELILNEKYNNGACSSIKKAMPHVKTDSIVVTHGDLWFSYLQLNNIFKKQKSTIVATTCKHMKSKEIGIKEVNQKLMYFGWRQKLKWGKIFYIYENYREIFEDTLYNNSTDSWFSFEILAHMLKAGCDFEIYTHENSLFDVDCYQDLRKIR